MHRLLAHYGDAAVNRESDPEECWGLWIPALLEHGDSVDLRWLFATFGQARLGRWLVERGGRQLSIRSRLFWEEVLGVQARPAESTAEALWPH